MRLRFWAVRFAFILSVILGAVLLTSAPGPQFTKRDKAYYADPNLVNFVRPGLQMRVLSASIATDGTIKARIRLTDPRGLPLDREGIVTPGTVAVSLIAAVIPRGQTQYTSYTTRIQTSTIRNVSATQAAADTGGVFTKVADGEYEYTFRTRAPAGFDRTATHTIGIYGSRNLTEFDLGTQYDNHTFNFVPDGSAVVTTRDIVRTATCNKCHDPLALHGGPRRSVEGCVLCHSPQTVDPDTGNTVDMPVMIHKIHMGANLPSVLAGGKYQIIGFGNSVIDFSTVRSPTDVRNCTVCHEQGTGAAAQANAYLKPSRAACGACHDDVNFATGANHVDLPQVSDNQCSTCHTPEGELEFDASIRGAHTIPTHSRDLPGTVFELVRVDDGSAGKRPTVTFTLKDKTGKPILPSEMTRLALVLAGPTTDYATYVSEDALRAEGSNGTYRWTFATALPADAKGSYTVGIEGYKNITLLPGTRKQMVARDAGVNKVIHFSADGSTLEPRRTIVSDAKCNRCHSGLELHGSNRNRIDQCVLCHNPNQTDAAVRPAAEGAAESIDFRTMIHKIHTGEELSAGYTVFGRGSSRHDYSEVLYPGDRRNCEACHVGGSEQVPLRENLRNVVNPRGLLNPTGPTTAACIGCHTTRAVASHALANTTVLGESCAACHGTNSDFSVNRAHAR